MRPLIVACRQNVRLDPLIVATGTHMHAEFGATLDAIIDDDITPDGQYQYPLGDGTGAANALAAAAAASGIVPILRSLAPHLIVLLGDRFETLAIAESALLMSIPIVHIHGGDITAGALDDALRHAISKLAAIHLVATDGSRQRLLQTGEPAARIFVTGSPAIDNVMQHSVTGRTELAQVLALPLEGPYFLCTWHPVTRNPAETEAGLTAMINAMASFPQHRWLFTGSNMDAGFPLIRDKLRGANLANPDRCLIVQSLGTHYLSAAAHADAVVGNSSSGIIEVASLGTPSVNIGTRQAGRERNPSTIDCDAEDTALGAALARALTKGHQQVAARGYNCYGDGNAAATSVRILASLQPGTLVTKALNVTP
jgi:UDP-hydrolysing UDP-N-acetyl-D-glucosamine 2-epimerase